MKIQPFTLGEVATNTYVVYGDESDAILIDAPDKIDKVITFLHQNGLNLTHILLTHAHFDHVMGLGAVLKEFPKARVFVACEDDFFLRNKGEGNIELLSKAFPFMLTAFKRYLDELPQTYSFYSDSILSFRVIRTPGHTKGSVCLYDEKERILFSGDTIFKGSYGRTDFPGGDQRELFTSIKELIKTVKDDTLVLPGHGEFTSIKDEKAFYGL